MSKRWLYPGVLSLLAATALLFIPSVSHAQQGRGGYGYGRRGVGYSYGSTSYYGNWGYGNSGYGYRPYYNSYYPSYYGSNWGYYPRTYGGYYYPNNYYYGNNYYSNGSYASTPNVSSYQSFYPSEGVTGAYSSAPAQNDRSVFLSIRVPPNAELWFGDVKTNETGSERSFVSPPLEPGQGYTYELRARWTENGQTVDRKRTLQVHAGDRLSIDFLIAAQSTPTTTNAFQPAERQAGDRSNPPPNSGKPRIESTQPPPQPEKP